MIGSGLLAVSPGYVSSRPFPPSPLDPASVNPQHDILGANVDLAWLRNGPIKLFSILEQV